MLMKTPAYVQFGISPWHKHPAYELSPKRGEGGSVAPSELPPVRHTLLPRALPNLRSGIGLGYYLPHLWCWLWLPPAGGVYWGCRSGDLRTRPTLLGVGVGIAIGVGKKLEVRTSHLNSPFPRFPRSAAKEAPVPPFQWLAPSCRLWCIIPLSSERITP